MKSVILPVALWGFGVAVWAGPVSPVAVAPHDGLLPAAATAGIMELDAADKEAGLTWNGAVVTAFKRAGGTLPVAVDAGDANADTPDRIRIDVDGDGKFGNALTIPLEVVVGHFGHYRGTFGPVEAQVPAGGKTIPVTFRGSYQLDERTQELTLYMGTAVQGRCSFGGTAHVVRLIDGNANLHLGDRVAPAGITYTPGDRVEVDLGAGDLTGPVATALYGQPVLVDGTWYQVALSADGAELSATPVEVPTARLSIAHDRWAGVLVGEKYVLDLAGGKEEISVPADVYTVVAYRETAMDMFGDPALLIRKPDARTFPVPAGAATALAVGSPLTATARMNVDPQFRSADIAPLLCDVSGAEVELQYSDDRRWSAEAEYAIFSAKGEMVQREAFEHG